MFYEKFNESVRKFVLSLETRFFFHPRTTLFESFTVTVKVTLLTSNFEMVKNTDRFLYSSQEYSQTYVGSGWGIFLYFLENFK